jgi:hypothetical protein
MPRTNVPVSSISRAGKPLTDAGTAGDSTNDHEVVNDGHMMIRVKNTNASPRTVTLNIQRTVDDRVPAARTVNIPATTGDVLIGPFPVADYGTLMTFDLDADTNVTVYAYSLVG